MDVLSGRPSSSLNPDAPPFVPLAYRAVEDFSDEWWDLVKSSVWFRDYWLRECFLEEAPGLPDDDASFLPEIGDIFDGYHQHDGEEVGREKGMRDVITWGAEKWHGLHGGEGSPKYAEKAPRVVKMKPSPRTIQQPR